MTLEQVLKKLSDRNLVKVAEKSDVSYATLMSLTQGRNKNPSYQTMQKLEKYLKEN